MNVRLAAVPLLALLAGGCIVPDPGDSVEGRLHLLGGFRALEDTDELDAFERVPTGGFALGFGSQGQGPGLELGVIYSEDDDELLGVDAHAKVFEVFSGYRYDFALDYWRPSFGFGLAYVGWQMDAEEPFDFDDEDDTVGAYARLGLEYLVTDTFSIGLLGRYFVGKELDLDVYEVDPDYGELFLTLGFRY